MLESSQLVPVYTEIVADLDTPLTLFAKVSEAHELIFLFESMEGGEKWGRYSFIGFDPLTTFVSKDENIEITDFSVTPPEKKVITGNPLDALRNLIEDVEAAEYENLPRFCGGAVGFLGYDMVRFMEELPDENSPVDLPDSSFMIPRIVLVYDSLKQKVTVVCWVKNDQGDSQKLYRDARSAIDAVVDRLRGPVPENYLQQSDKEFATSHSFTSNMSQADFQQMVERAKEYIRAGDIIQVVLSQRFHTTTALPPMLLYRALRQINPSPYLFFLKLGDLIQIGSSPEILVRKDGNHIELRPIAGTRRRGVTEEEDLALAKELLADPKERAEHLMLVDLGRNDVGRVAEGGQVEVRDLLVIERYSHVMHIVSGVHGIIAQDKDQFDVMSACFPAGTVSGAPKIRAMEIIDELEPERRGPYAGAVGYFGFSGNMDFCITIRTITISNNRISIQAGAGIVADSDPEEEYKETIRKASATFNAIERVRES